MNKIFRRLSYLGIGALSILSIGVLVSCSSSNQGLSAYEIAVQNGYSGTEEEWLLSLEGTDGTDGSDASIETTYEMYETAVESGEYDGSYLEFLEEYLSTSYSISYLMNNSLLQNVSITATFNVNTTTTMGPGRSQTTTEEQQYAGSGVFYSIDTKEGSAYIITAYHVIYEADSTAEDGICDDIKCYLYGTFDNEDYAMDAYFVGGDINTDIAILKIENSDIIKNNNYISAVTFGKYNNLYIGESIYAIGNNKGQDLSANAGTLSLLSYECSYEISDTVVTVRSLRYDAATNAGDSGGALYNEYGELIGIINCKMEDTGVEGMQYAVPVSVVEGLAYKIVNNYEKTNSYKNTFVSLDIELEDTNLTIYKNSQTGMYNTKADVVISSIGTNSVLKNTNIKAGDTIISLELNPNSANNRILTVYNSYDIEEFLYWASKDDTLTVNYLRDGVEYSETVTLSYAK